MRLNIQRKQNEVRGMLGGSKGFTFTLSYRVDLTQAERGVVDKYKLMDYPVTFTTFQGTSIPDDTIGKLLNGASQTVNSVETLLKNEEVIKRSCDSLPTLFAVIQSFGGNEVIDYPRK